MLKTTWSLDQKGGVF